MFLPISTDAPVYHWPYATLGLIVVNTIAWAVVPWTVALDPAGVWFLSYGQGLRPEQWFGSLFMHTGFFHLLFNMAFLWVFGLVVEGKLGWWRFQAIYLAIGVTECAIEQAAMLGYQGLYPGSLGSSSAIFGVMAIAAIWAPANGVSVWSFFGLFDAPVGMFVGLFVIWEMAWALLLGGFAVSSMLHLLGAGIGFPIGVFLLRRGVVDCEGWDLFSRMGSGEKPANEKEEAASEVIVSAAQRDQRLLSESTDAVDRFLLDGNAVAALTLYRKMSSVGEGLRLSTKQLASLVKGLHAEKRWAESAPFMAELIERVPEKADPLRIKLAQISLVELNRPGRALDLLAAVDASQLSEQQHALAEKISAKAEGLQQSGLVEIDDGGWEPNAG